MELLNTFRFILTHPFNREHKLRAVNRFFRWHLGSRMLPGKVAVAFVNDVRLLVNRGMRSATGNIYTGLHEFEDMAFVLHCLRPQDTFVDVGANVGSYTVLAGGAVGAKCIALEPGPDTYQHLLDNILFNSLTGRVDAQNIGVGKESGSLRFTIAYPSATRSHMATTEETQKGGSANTITVRVETLDAICADSDPTVIKIDVEGFETQVIAGGQATLAKDSLLAVIMELNGSGARYGFNDHAIHQQMLDNGFQPFTYAPFERKLVDFNRAHASHNTIYVKDVDRVSQRLANAPAYQVQGRSI